MTRLLPRPRNVPPCSASVCTPPVTRISLPPKATCPSFVLETILLLMHPYFICLLLPAHNTIDHTTVQGYYQLKLILKPPSYPSFLPSLPPSLSPFLSSSFPFRTLVSEVSLFNCVLSTCVC